MLWVDHESYFGPDRRGRECGLRLIERRRMNCAGAPPPLSTALRQLRLRVLDARGGAVKAFAKRVQGTAQLADMLNEPAAAFELAALGMALDRTSIEDARPQIYATLDRAHALMRAA